MRYFNLQSRVLPNEGYFDGIKLHISGFDFIGDASRINASLLHSLEAHPYREEGGYEPDLSLLSFRHPSTPTPRVRRLSSRKELEDLDGRRFRSLAGAELYFHLPEQQNDRQGQRTIWANGHLLLNPTRFDAYDDRSRERPHLYERPYRRSVNEFCLVTDDNVLLWESQQHRSQAGDTLLRYFDAAEGGLASGLRRAAEESDVRLRWHPTYCLSHAEVYWEFAHDNPVALVHELFRLYLQASDRSIITRARLESGDNSLCIRCAIASGIWLRVYAKTNCRVRFELIFERRKMRAECRSEIFEPWTGWLSNGIETLLEFRHEAAAILNGFLDVAHVWTRSPSHTFADLLKEIGDATRETPGAVPTILALLSTTGRINTRTCPRLRHVCLQLLSLGVLERPKKYSPVVRLKSSWRGVMPFSLPAIKGSSHATNRWGSSRVSRGNPSADSIRQSSRGAGGSRSVRTN